MLARNRRTGLNHGGHGGRTRKKKINVRVKSGSTVRKPVRPFFTAPDNQPTKKLNPRIFLSLVLPPCPPCPPCFKICLNATATRPARTSAPRAAPSRRRPDVRRLAD